MIRIGLGARFGAALIDMMALGGITLPIALFGAGSFFMAIFWAIFIPFTGGQSAGKAESALTNAWIVVPIIYGVVVLYCLIELLVGGSPGKLLMGQQIRMDDGSVPPFSVLLYRWILKYCWLIPYGVIILISYGLGKGGDTVEPLFWVARGMFLAVFFGSFLSAADDRKALHDRIAGTIVVLKQSIPPNQPLEPPTSHQIEKR